MKVCGALFGNVKEVNIQAGAQISMIRKPYNKPLHLLISTLNSEGFNRECN